MGEPKTAASFNAGLTGNYTFTDDRPVNPAFKVSVTEFRCTKCKKKFTWTKEDEEPKYCPFCAEPAEKR